MKGFIVYPTYEVIDDQTYIQLFGRLENGKSFVTINKIEPYFFIAEEDAKKLLKFISKCTITKTDLTNFQGKKVVKASAKNHLDLNKLSEYLHKKGINTYEADIKPQFRFIIDNNLLGMIDIEGEHNGQPNDRVDNVYIEPKIKPSEFNPELKILSLDTESNKTTRELFCIGLYSKNYKKNFMVTNHKLKDTVSCISEEECLRKFRDEIIKLDPDIITGWSLIDFDLKDLQEKFKKYKIPFDIGRTNENVRIKIEDNFFRASSADIPGRQVLDALSLVRDPFIQEAPSIRNAEFETYTLEDVSQAILGTGKLMKGKSRHDQIEKLFYSKKKEDHEALVEYNLLDCKLVYDILEKAKMIELAIERSHLTGIPLDRLTGSIIAFDSLYIREARKRDLVSPTTRYGNKEARITGGYVSSLNPGIFKNVLIFDFKSLYPSIIKTFNIDPASHLEHKEKDTIEAPNGVYFKNSHGVLPELITKLHYAREKAKREKRELSSYAIKIIQNSFFGVLASPNCRYFSLDIANAITYFGRMIIQLTAKEIEKKGHKVIYQDTDSTFVETNLNKEKANALAKELQEYINKFYEGYIKKNYNRQSFLELEFKKQYLYLLIPKIRVTKDEEVKAAKKRYAGLLEVNGKEEIEVTGLEFVRGDWTEAAKEFQMELLKKVFHNESIEAFIKQYIKKIKEGKMNDKLIYRKSIRKNLEEYTKTTPPHVKAARKLEKLDSNIIQYYMTKDGPEPIQKLKHKIDYDHYIEKQIKPIANQILSLLNKDFDATVQSSKQSTLF